MQGHKVNMMHKKSNKKKKKKRRKGGAESKILEGTEKKRKWAQNKKVGLTGQI